MRPLPLCLLLLCLLLVPPLDARAQHDEVPFRHYGVQDGLPHEDVYELAQTPDGQLWIGTQTGLAVFDGERIVTLPMPDSIGTAVVNKLAVMPDGSLWAGVHGHGVLKVEDRRFVEALSTGDVTATRLLPRGDSLYVFAPRAYWIRRPDGQVTQHDYGYPIRIHKDPEPAQGWGVVDAARAPDGTFWVLDSRRGPGRLTAEGEVVFPTQVPPAPGHPRWSHLAWAGGSLLLSQGPSLYRYRPADDVFEEVASPGLITEIVPRTEAGREVVYVTSSGGMLRLDAESGQVLRRLTAAQGLPTDKMRYVLHDPTGRMWLGTRNGLVHLFAPGVRHVRQVGDVSLLNVGGMTGSGEAGVWGRSFGSGLVRVRPELTVAMPDSRRFWSDVYAYDGETYALSEELYRLEDDGRWRQLRATDGAVRGYVSREGVGFFWHDDGLHQLDLDSDAPPRRIYPWVTDRSIQYAFTLTPDGTLLVRDHDRLRRGRPPAHPDSSWRFETVAELPGFAEAHGRYVAADPEGNVWLPFWREGLIHLDLDDEQPVPSRVVPNRFVTRTAFLGDSLVLALADDGLHVVRADDRTVLRHLTQEDGLLSTTVRGAAALGDTLYLGHPRGLTKLPLARLLARPEAPRTLLTGLERRGRAMPLTDTLFDAADRTVGFDFAATALAHRQGLRYEYRLLPGEPAWRHSARSFIRYTHLPPGRHRFEVRARYGDAPPGEAAGFAFTVPRYLHETWGFRLAMLLALVLGASGLYRWRIVLLRRREQTLARQVAERTEELRREKERTEEQAHRLAELDRAKSRFFANLSHEFRTPLTLILGPLRDLLEGRHGALSDEVRRRLGTTVGSAQRLHDLIGRLLDLTKLDAGRMTIHPRRQDLVAFLRERVGAFTPLAECEDLDLHLHTAWEHRLLAFDDEALRTVLDNLLSNALKFTPEGGTVWVTAEPAEGNLVHLVVKDTGPGISEQALLRIFDRFAQADETTTRRHEGTGIGLALAKELTELHGGTLGVESVPGLGTAFTVRLPADLEAQHPTGGDGRALETPPPALALPQHEGETPLPVVDGDAKRPTILISDDNAQMRVYLRDHLQEDYVVVEACDGQQALKRARLQRPDLLLSDVMMPEMDGYALCRALREDPDLQTLPIVLLTARADEADKQDGYAHGADAYISKPFDVTTLRRCVAALLERRACLQDAYGRAVTVDGLHAPVDEDEVPFLEQVLSVVGRHLADEHFAVADLAEAVALSKRQLTRRLKDATGETPAALVRRIRLEEAARLLEGAPSTVAEVGYAVGFSSPSTFSRAFRKRFGCTPSEYVDRAPEEA